MIVWLVIKVTERVPIEYFIPLDVDIHEYKYIVAFMCSHESAPWSIQNQCNIRAECNNKLDFMPDCCITPDQRPPPPHNGPTITENDFPSSTYILGIVRAF